MILLHFGNLLEHAVQNIVISEFFSSKSGDFGKNNFTKMVCLSWTGFFLGCLVMKTCPREFTAPSTVKLKSCKMKIKTEEIKDFRVSPLALEVQKIGSWGEKFEHLL
jgi:hypothetical protein